MEAKRGSAPTKDHVVGGRCTTGGTGPRRGRFSDTCLARRRPPTHQPTRPCLTSPLESVQRVGLIRGSDRRPLRLHARASTSTKSSCPVPRTPPRLSAPRHRQSQGSSVRPRCVHWMRPRMPVGFGIGSSGKGLRTVGCDGKIGPLVKDSLK